jgi:hypothetical protein
MLFRTLEKSEFRCLVDSILKANEVIQIEIHHAKSLFDSKEAEQGRNVLE